MTGVAGESSPQSLPVEDALLADALLGGGLPPEASSTCGRRDVLSFR